MEQSLSAPVQARPFRIPAAAATGFAALVAIALLAASAQQDAAPAQGDIWRGNSASLERIADAPATVPAR
ncbi:hypothetical protein [Poseidonocella sp. HB161398]|uniref:hypothetical protein n=1 Tax=Poseidonocella sp. HB161398 TaxID=2320855 RepID=UPI001108E6B4|nr:hypothetical protein [Poseidonocella sp. HB161398]